MFSNPMSSPEVRRSAGPREYRNDETRSSSSAAALRKPGGASSPSGGSRASVRYPAAGVAAGSSRYSRGSVRASVRQPGQSGLSALGGVERVQVVDEDGRDRTPKPLLASSRAAHSHHGSTGMGAEGNSAWPSEGGDSLGAGACANEGQSYHSHLAGLAALASLSLAEWLQQDAGGGQQVVMPPALPLRGGATGAPGAPRVAPWPRERATQCQPPVFASQACQVLPWELECNGAQHCNPDSGGADADLTKVTSLAGPKAAAAEDAMEREAEGEMEQKEAMQAVEVAAQESLQGAGGSSMLRSDSPADRASRGGSSLGRASAAHDLSRRSSGTSDRASMMSRSSMAMFGAGSFVGQPGGGASSRTSVMVPAGNRQHASSSLSASEAAAEAARRAKADAARALARLPGVESRLVRLERTLVQNAFHPMIVRSKHVQFCDDGAGTSAGSATTLAASEAGGVPGADGDDHPDRTPSLLPVAGAPDGKVAAAPGAWPGGSPGAGASAGELQKLWQWTRDPMEELPVSCIAWSRGNPDLLAVGYGRLEYTVEGRGLVVFYSLLNPGGPVWQLATPCGVSSLDFSARSCGTLAVGMFDGSVALYEVRNRSGVPVARAPPTGPDGSGGHAEPVWGLRYVSCGGEGEEQLVSTSTDGRVLAWKHTQTLDHADLMRLKRPASQQQQPKGGEQGGATTEGLLGRHAGGTCFDFSPADPRIYLVGTEEGQVHKCSTAFTEQYIQTYTGHTAPIYQVRWSPFRPSCFLTCSADWTLRLWGEARPGSLWTFQPAGSAKSEVNDVQWSPCSGTVFAAAAGNTLQLWDLQHSVLRPRAFITRYGVRLTCVSFCPGDAPVLACGADDGSVAIYSVAGVHGEAAPSTAREAQRLGSVLEASIYQHLVG